MTVAWSTSRRSLYTATVQRLGQALNLTPGERARLEAAGRPLGQPNSDSFIRAGIRPARTSLIGRERELAELHRLLAETRLLTLTGVGGVGKTRLALELAASRVRTPSVHDIAARLDDRFQVLTALAIRRDTGDRAQGTGDLSRRLAAIVLELADDAQVELVQLGRARVRSVIALPKNASRRNAPTPNFAQPECQRLAHF